MTATHITNYPQLLKILATNQKIVYLCGAGASMSLGDHKLSWSNWIHAGRNYLSDFDKVQLDNKIGQETTDDLISSITVLLNRLKVSGLYSDFMASTIGALHPINHKFEDALKNMWRTGDLIATTNYDLQIEESIKAASASYSTPADILSVIQGEGNKVIHLHGVYDRSKKIDDIIADESQYQKILKNEGAQFIQNLIGTHPLIIVGCGRTVEDPNLSVFLNFIVEKLGITNTPYFFLMKKGDEIPQLPPNAIPVFYGDDYSDLPIFLSELALLRLKKRVDTHGIISVNPYTEPTSAITAFGRMHFTSEFNEFIGRNDELRQLEEFLKNDNIFSWWTVIGDGGIGKSRLVLEWLRNTPTHWFGFFSDKNALKIQNFTPFTNTIVVFDYVLGNEKEYAQAIDTYLDIFKESKYKLRILFIERVQKSNEWLKCIKQSLKPEKRLLLDKNEFGNPMKLGELSVNEEVQYIENYLKAYIPIVNMNAFTHKCELDFLTTSKNINKSFRASVKSDCYRPLYLSIYIEVWISKEGKILLSSAEDLMQEYLERERKRWLLTLGNDELVDSYMRVLSIACAIDRFDITDVYGDNYLKEDCQKLITFFDNRCNKPGANNLFEDLFVSMDELVEDDGSDPIVDCFTKSEITEKITDDDRLALFSPYIKLRADPTEVYLSLLVEKGCAGNDQIEQLRQIQEKNHLKKFSLPNYDWVVKPVLPNIIKEFLVNFVVKSWNVVKFTKLARSNSVLGFHNFIILAIDDQPNNSKFQKMIVTPPDEALNFFEFYASVLIRINDIDDLESIESTLIHNEHCFIKYEIELWRRIACILIDKKDVQKLYDSGIRFIEYLKCFDREQGLRVEVIDVIKLYCIGIHNSCNELLYTSFLREIDKIENQLPQTEQVGLALCENYRMSINLKQRCNEDDDAATEWARIQKIIEKYGCSEKIVKIAMDAAREYMQALIYLRKMNKLKKLEEFLELVYMQCPIENVAEIAALATANGHLMCSDQNRLKEGIKKLERYLVNYSDNMRVQLAYISLCNTMYMATSSSKMVPNKILDLAQKCEKKYPGKNEFAEAYFGLLMSQLEYTLINGSKSEQKRLFKKMDALAKRTDYSEYHEENQLKQTVQLLKELYEF